MTDYGYRTKAQQRRMIRIGDQERYFTAAERRILYLLTEQPGAYILKQSLTNIVSEHCLKVHLARIRKKLQGTIWSVPRMKMGAIKLVVQK